MELNELSQMFYLTLQPATLNLDNISWVCTDNRTLAFVVHKICHNFCSHLKVLAFSSLQMSVI